MPRPIWTGSISFGLVNVPVKLFSAVSQQEIHFHQLHKEDGSRVRMKRVCSADGEEVPYEDIAKGYEISKGRYVMVTKDELEKFNPKATKTIDISDFVKQEEIDPIYWEHTYHVGPDKGAGKAFNLLLEAMKKTGRVGIAHVVMRTKQYLCTLRPLEGGGLALSTMNYADEIVDQKDIDIDKPAGHPSEKELKMAEQLIEALASDFEPDKYQDEYREQVKALLEAKADGEEVVEPSEEEEEPQKVVSLMDALERSLSEGRGERRAPQQKAAKQVRAKKAPAKKAPAKKAPARNAAAKKAKKRKSA